MEPNLSTLTMDWNSDLTMDWESDVMVDSKNFREGIGTWAKDFSVRYRAGSGPKPTLADARSDLQRWSKSYWARQTFAGDCPEQRAT